LEEQLAVVEVRIHLWTCFEELALMVGAAEHKVLSLREEYPRLNTLMSSKYAIKILKCI
jgi:hypothetical protein